MSVLTPNAEDHKPLTETHERNTQSSVQSEENEENEDSDKDQEDEDSPKAFRGELRIRRKVLCLSVTPARNSRDEEGEDEDEDEERLIPHTDNQPRSSARPTPASITEKHSHAERRYLTL